jgi:hypothetical protein
MGDQRTIQVRWREVYGKELCYPVCEAAEIFSNLAGQKTLTVSTLSMIEALGYRIETAASSETETVLERASRNQATW